MHVGNAKCNIASFELNSELKSASSKTDSEESVVVEYPHEEELKADVMAAKMQLSTWTR